MLQLAKDNGCNISNRFGDGPNWRMRVIRAACDVLGLNSDIILKHSFQRGLFAGIRAKKPEEVAKKIIEVIKNNNLTGEVISVE